MAFLMFKANKLDARGALSRDSEMDLMLIVNSNRFKGSVGRHYYTIDDSEGLLLEVNGSKYVQLSFMNEIPLGDEMGFIDVTALNLETSKRQRIRLNTEFVSVIEGIKVFTKFDEPILFGKVYFRDFELPGIGQ